MMVFRKRHSLIIVIFCLACAMSPLHSHAHRMLTDCMLEGKSVSVDVFFPDGKPAKNVKVEVYRADETLYLSGETDAEGQFSFDLANETHLKVVAMGKLGHRAEQEISLSDAAPQVPEKPAGTTLTKGNRRHDSIPFRDIFAGLGYIFGAAGVLMYLKARSDLRKANVSSGDR